MGRGSADSVHPTAAVYPEVQLDNCVRAGHRGWRPVCAYGVLYAGL
jgi:hypothetical protein